jgi:hypothetical protein
VALFVLAMLVPFGRDFYALRMPPTDVFLEAAIVAAAACVLLEIGYRAAQGVGARRARR